MARPLRIAFQGAFYHVTARGNERKAVFKSKRARSGHLFQGRYKAIVVEKDEYAKELSRYIHLNPVRAKMVQTPEQYEWTSYQFYIGKEKAPPWLQCRFILDYFGDPIKAAQKGYEKFVSQLADKDYESPLKDVFGSVLLGSQAFINFIKNEFISSQKSDRNVLALIQLASQATIPDICQTVESVFGGTPRLSRKVKIFLCRKHTIASLAVIGDRFGVGDSAVAQSCSRFLNEMKTDRHLRRQVEKIEKTIKLCNVETPHPFEKNSVYT